MQNEAAPFVAEYIARKRLAKLGFTTSIHELDAFTAEIFCLIDSELDKIHEEEVKKASGRRK